MGILLISGVIVGDKECGQVSGGRLFQLLLSLRRELCGYIPTRPSLGLPDDGPTAALEFQSEPMQLNRLAPNLRQMCSGSALMND